MQVVENPFFLGADTIFWASVHLFISDIKTSKTSMGFFYKTHPIQKVTIAGIVTSISIQASKFILEIDDGSDFINCLYWYSDSEKKTCPFKFQLGDLISLQGRISDFRDEIQIIIINFKVESDPNYELLHWASVLLLKKEYEIPFQIPLGLKNELTNLKEFKSLKTETRNEIKDFLKTIFESNIKIEFQQLKKRSDLLEFSRLYLSSKENHEISDSQIELIIAKNTRLLTKEGFIYQKNEDTDTFELISLSNLGNFIIHSIKDLCTKNLYGVSGDEIMAILSSTCFKSVPKPIVFGMLRELADMAKIHKVSANEYRA
jgi:hypothetical protein